MAARTRSALFLPDLDGRHVLWRETLSQVAQTVSRVVQLGNLVGCDSRAADRDDSHGANRTLLAYIRMFNAGIRPTPGGAWTQLAGPSEMAALNAPGRWTCDEATVTLLDWWDPPAGMSAGMVTAVADHGRLVSHGGLTYGQWVDIGRPTDAVDAATSLNVLYNTTLAQGQCLRLGDGPTFSANPIWADPVAETIPSWVCAPVDPPFGQVMSGGLSGRAARARMKTPDDPLHFLDEVRFRSFGSVATVGGKQFVGLTLGLTDRDAARLTMPHSAYIEENDPETGG